MSSKQDWPEWFVPGVEGGIVRDPVTRAILPPEGGRLPDTSYFRRRLAQGDIAPATPPKPQPMTSVDELDETAGGND